MCVQSIVRKVYGLHGVKMRHKGQPRQNTSHIGDATSKEHHGGTKLEQ